MQDLPPELHDSGTFGFFVVRRWPYVGCLGELMKLTLTEYAKELGLPVELLMEQLLAAGVPKKSNDDFISESDKFLLLEHLRSKYSTPTKICVNTYQVKRCRAEDPSTGLSKEQKAFLAEHGIPLSKIFNATGMSSSRYKLIMKDGDFLVAYGVTPCSRGGHTLRTRSGHCVQCNTKHIAYIRRHSEPGYVYLLHSKSTNLVKVGASVDPNIREKNLNGYAYGGASDWMIIEKFYTKDYAKHENLAHQSLETYRTSGKYFDRGGWIECNELFTCSVEVAKKAIVSALK